MSSNIGAVGAIGTEDVQKVKKPLFDQGVQGGNAVMANVQPNSIFDPSGSKVQMS